MSSLTGSLRPPSRPNMQQIPGPYSELGKWITEFCRKLVAGEYAFYCTCTKPESDPKLDNKYCKNCRGFLWGGYWV